MFNGKTISLVMPARNETHNVDELLTDVPTLFDEIIVVSNKSTDDTFEHVEAMAEKDSRIRALKDDRTNKVGCGVGYASRTGVDAATGDIVVVCDFDGTYPFYDETTMAALLSPLSSETDPTRFVAGNRYPDDEIPLFLRFGVTVLTIIGRVLYRLPCHDILTGMFAFYRKDWPSFACVDGGWDFCPEIKVNAHAVLGDKYIEVKIKQRNRLGDETKQNYWQTGFNHLKYLFRHRFSKEYKALLAKRG